VPVCVCVYGCACACACVCMDVPVPVWVWVCLCLCLCVGVCLYMCQCRCGQMYLSRLAGSHTEPCFRWRQRLCPQRPTTNNNTRQCMYVCECVYVQVCMCV
jgi:hypothetical protein